MAVVEYRPALSQYNFGYSGTLLWQTFLTPSGIDRLEFVQVPLTRIGSVASNCTLGIYATSGGVPTGSAIGNASYVANNISTSFGVYYQFNYNIAVSPNTVYALVFNSNGTSSSNTIAWDSAGVNGYGSGTGGYKYSSGGWASYGFDLAFYANLYQSAVAPTVTTGAVSSITTSGATVAGNVTSDGGSTIQERGICYSNATSTPTIAHPRKSTTGTTGSYSVALTGLSSGTTYYARAYASNALGVSYGAVTTFETTAVAPSISTIGLTEIKAESVKGSANITADGGEPVTSRGLAYDTSTAPTTADSTVTAGTGTGTFTAQITGLTPSTLYYVRPYATNSIGTTYGSEVSFTALDTVDKWGQSFTSTATGILSEIQLYLRLVQGSVGTVKVSIWSDNAGTPDTRIANLTPRTITNTAYEWVVLSTNVSITDTNVYWIVLEDPYIVGSYHIAWGANSAGGYASGAVKYTKSSASSSWINTNYTTHDTAFKVDMQPMFTPDYDVRIEGRKRYLS